MGTDENGRLGDRGQGHRGPIARYYQYLRTPDKGQACAKGYVITRNGVVLQGRARVWQVSFALPAFGERPSVASSVRWSL